MRGLGYKPTHTHTLNFRVTSQPHTDLVVRAPERSEERVDSPNSWSEATAAPARERVIFNASEAVASGWLMSRDSELPVPVM